MLTKREKNQLSTIIKHLDANNKQWFDNQNIAYSEKGNFWILNYNPDGRNPYNRLCRGLVVAKKNNWSLSHRLQAWFNPCCRIASLPFVRFHNDGETYIDAYGREQKAGVDFEHSEMIEKLDGIMVGVFFPYGDHEAPEYHTRRLLSTHASDLEIEILDFHKKKPVRLLQLIGECVKKLNFTPEDINYTHIFEFIHHSIPILTQYSEAWNGLWLTGSRNLNTLQETIDQKELDIKAASLGCRRPITFNNSHNNIDEIVALMEQRAKDIHDFEGVVLLDQQGNRVKVKRKQYVALHHFLGEVSYKNLIPRILDGEEQEIMAYFPSVLALVNNFKQVYKNYWANVASRVMYWRSMKLDRKTLAGKLFNEKQEKDSFLKNQIMRLFLEQNDSIIWQDIDTELRTIGKSSPKKLMEIIGLTDL